MKKDRETISYRDVQDVRVRTTNAGVHFYPWKHFQRMEILGGCLEGDEAEERSDWLTL